MGKSMSYDTSENTKDAATLKADAENELLLAEKSGNRVDIANTYLSEIIEEKRLKAEKKKEEDFKNLLLQHELSLLNDLDEIFNGLDGTLDEFKASRDRQNRMANAERNGDFDTLRLIFINEYGMDADKVNKMSHDELREQRIQFDNLEQQNQAVIITEIRELAEQYKQRAKELGETRPDLAQAELDKLDAIRYKSAALGLDFEKIFNNTAQDGYSDFYSATSKNKYLQIPKPLATEFDKVAPIQTNKQLSIKNENSLFEVNDVSVVKDTPNLFN